MCFPVSCLSSGSLVPPWAGLSPQDLLRTEEALVWPSPDTRKRQSGLSPLQFVPGPMPELCGLGIKPLPRE